MANIQDQGFAKQNYTMLDNLKLGYGGTKDEMKRLLKDASKISGIKYDISSFADVTEAIHVMQVEMGIAGTTSKEASSTISGSLGMVKASWQNVLTAMADEEADFSGNIQNLVDSVGTFAENILPRIEIALSGVGDLITQLAPVIIEKVPELINNLLPPLLQGAIEIVNAVIKVLPDLLRSITNAISQNKDLIINSVFDVLNMLVDTVLDMLPDIIKLGLELVVALAEGLSQNAEEIIIGIVDCIVEIVDYLTQPNNLTMLLKAAISLIVALTKGIIKAIPKLFDGLDQIVVNLVAWLSDLLGIVWDWLKGLWSKISASISSFWESTKAVFSTIVDWLYNTIVLPIANFFTSLWNGIVTAVTTAADGIKTAFSAVGTFFSDLWNSVLAVVQEIFNTVVTWISENVVEPIKNAFNTVIGPWIEIFEKIVALIKEWIDKVISDLKEWAEGIYNDVVKPVADFFTNLWDEIVDAFSSAWQWVKDICSTIANWISNNVIQPIANFFTNLWNGITNGINNAINGAKEIFSKISDWVKTNVIEPLTTFFTDLWSKFSTAGSDAWEAIKGVFSKVGEFFGNVFSTAWQKVKDIFSTGGEVFSGIKDGILAAFKKVVNTLITGINKVVAIPFNGLNTMLNTLAGVEILKVKPFSWLTWRAEIPEIPQLYEGGILKKGEIGLLEGRGDEAVVPLHNNKKWISAVAKEMENQTGKIVNITFSEKSIYIDEFNGEGESDINSLAEAIIEKMTAKIQSKGAVFA